MADLFNAFQEAVDRDDYPAALSAVDALMQDPRLSFALCLEAVMCKYNIWLQLEYYEAAKAALPEVYTLVEKLMAETREKRKVESDILEIQDAVHLGKIEHSIACVFKMSQEPKKSVHHFKRALHIWGGFHLCEEEYQRLFFRSLNVLNQVYAEQNMQKQSLGMLRMVYRRYALPVIQKSVVLMMLDMLVEHSLWWDVRQITADEYVQKQLKPVMNHAEKQQFLVFQTKEYLSKGDIEQGLAVIQECLQLESVEFDTFFHMMDARVRFLVRSNDDNAGKQALEAVEELKKKAAEHEHGANVHALVWKLQGVALLKDGQYDAAITCFNACDTSVLSKKSLSKQLAFCTWLYLRGLDRNSESFADKAKRAKQTFDTLSNNKNASGALFQALFAFLVKDMPWVKTMPWGIQCSLNHAFVHLKAYLDSCVKQRRDECSYCGQQHCDLCTKPKAQDADGKVDGHFKFYECKTCRMEFCSRDCLKRSWKTSDNEFDSFTNHASVCKLLLALKMYQSTVEDKTANFEKEMNDWLEKQTAMH